MDEDGSYSAEGFRVSDRRRGASQLYSIPGWVVALFDVQTLGPPASPRQPLFEVRGKATDQEGMNLWVQ